MKTILLKCGVNSEGINDTVWEITEDHKLQRQLDDGFTHRKFIEWHECDILDEVIKAKNDGFNAKIDVLTEEEAFLEML